MIVVAYKQLNITLRVDNAITGVNIHLKSSSKYIAGEHYLNFNN